MYASLWKRGLAYLVDVFLIYIIIMIPFKNNLELIKTEMPSDLLAISFLIAILSLFYWAILEYKIQQSVGKMLFRIYVKSRTKKLSFWQCLVRNLTKMSMFFLFLDCLYLLITRGHQRYFERLSGTEVVGYAKKKK